MAKDRREWRKIVLEAKVHNGHALEEGMLWWRKKRGEEEVAEIDVICIDNKVMSCIQFRLWYTYSRYNQVVHCEV